MHYLWELRTVTDLADDFTLHAVPDACANLLFNQLGTRIAGVTQLHTSHTTLDLGRSFHYVGIQLFPLALAQVSEAAAKVDPAWRTQQPTTPRRHDRRTRSWRHASVRYVTHDRRDEGSASVTGEAHRPGGEPPPEALGVSSARAGGTGDRTATLSHPVRAVSMMTPTMGVERCL